MFTFLKNNRRAIVYTVALLGIGFVVGYVVKPSQIVSSKAIRENTNKYTFIHPLLAVNRQDDTPSPQFNDLYNSVDKLIDQKKKTTSLIDSSVYFISYDKNNGSFAINQDQKYSPASLLKVVIMIAYLKKSETYQNILNQKIVYTATIEQTLEKVPFETPSNLMIGQSYSFSELINRMIVDSDNGAKNILLSHIEDEYLNQVYSDLNLKGPSDNTDYTISVKDYALFLRVLFNATYLSDVNSEKALAILSKATFDKGLSIGVPSGTVIAHKFGEHINGKNDSIDSIELHDCGIVYYPKNPYLVCVMTRGKDIKVLQNTIGEISKTIYDFVSKQN
ncbi:MAG: serine hydrolase [bacterium]